MKSRIALLIVCFSVGLAAVQTAFYIVNTYRQGEAGMVQYMPDDGFYYLIVARNFAHSGIWSFDGNISTTTGFHPLFAYLLAGIRRLTSSHSMHFWASITVYIALVLGAAAMLFTALVKVTSAQNALVIMSMIITSYNWKVNSFALMEWPLVIIFASALILAVITGYEKTSARLLLVAFISGLLGSLSRTDFGLLPASLAMFALVSSLGRRSWQGLFIPITALAGATTGVVTALAHNYYLSGRIVQGSALMKSHWSSMLPPNPLPTLINITCLFGISPHTLANGVQAFLPHYQPERLPDPLEHAIYLSISSGVSKPSLTALAVILFAVGFLIYLGLSTFALVLKRPNGSLQNYVLLSSTGVIIGYIVLYGWVAREGVFSWYTANLLVPVALVVGIVVSNSRAKLLLLSSMAIMIIQHAYFISANHPPYPWQKDFARMGKYIQLAEFIDGPVAAFNAGITSYFSYPVQVVNVDGLMNDDVYSYVVNDRLWEYLDAIGIRYIADYTASIDGTEPDWLRRSGFTVASRGGRCVPLSIEFGRVGLFEWRESKD